MFPKPRIRPGQRDGDHGGRWQSRCRNQEAVDSASRHLRHDRREVRGRRSNGDAAPDVASERAELGEKAGRLVPAEHIWLLGDRDDVAPAQGPVGIRAEAGHPLGTVAMEAVEVRCLVLQVRRGAAVDEHGVRTQSRVALEGPLLVGCNRADDDVGVLTLDEPPGLDEGGGGRPVHAAVDEAHGSPADGCPVHARNRRPARQSRSSLDQRELGTSDREVVGERPVALAVGKEPDPDSRLPGACDRRGRARPGDERQGDRDRGNEPGEAPAAHRRTIAHTPSGPAAMPTGGPPTSIVDVTACRPRRPATRSRR